jgi:hypothetical protein
METHQSCKGWGWNTWHTISLTSLSLPRLYHDIRGEYSQSNLNHHSSYLEYQVIYKVQKHYTLLLKPFRIYFNYHCSSNGNLMLHTHMPNFLEQSPSREGDSQSDIKKRSLLWIWRLITAFKSADTHKPKPKHCTCFYTKYYAHVHCSSLVVKALGYKPEGRGFETQ